MNCSVLQEDIMIEWIILRIRHIDYVRVILLENGGLLCLKIKRKMDSNAPKPVRASTKINKVIPCFQKI